MRIGIAIGDVTGVGPEVALKAVAAESKKDHTQYVFIGDEGILERQNQKLARRLPIKKFPRDGEGRFFVTNPFDKKLPASLPAGAPLAAHAAVAALWDG